jgi:hypothetical protein
MKCSYDHFNLSLSLHFRYTCCLLTTFFWISFPLYFIIQVLETTNNLLSVSLVYALFLHCSQPSVNKPHFQTASHYFLDWEAFLLIIDILSVCSLIYVKSRKTLASNLFTEVWDAIIALTSVHSLVIPIKELVPITWIPKIKFS